MPKPLMQSLTEVDRKIQSAARVALFLDFDGTLAPIVEHPSAAHMPDHVREVLERLLQQDFVVTTIISGRAVEDVFVRTRLEGIVYAGNHGLEIFGRSLRFVEPEADARRDQLRRLSEVVAAKIRRIEGAWVEEKGLTTSVHYRQAEPVDYPAIEYAVRSSVAAAGALFRLNAGRKVLEILPRTGWHKGAAAQWILSHLGDSGMLPVYLGDDTTDEDAFVALKDAVTVRVGDARATCAQFALPSPDEVYQFLLWLEGRMAARTRVAGVSLPFEV